MDLTEPNSTPPPLNAEPTRATATRWLVALLLAALWLSDLALYASLQSFMSSLESWPPWLDEFVVGIALGQTALISAGIVWPIPPLSLFARLVVGLIWIAGLAALSST